MTLLGEARRMSSWQPVWFILDWIYGYFFVLLDVASKGLDFENIQHVINFEMPEDIENYGIANENKIFSFI